MVIDCDIGVYIDKNIKLVYFFCLWCRFKKRKLTLRDINPEFFVQILGLFKTYVQITGKELF